MITKKYYELLKESKLEEDSITSKTVPDEGKTSEDGMIITKPVLYHYAPNDQIESIKKHGLMNLSKLKTIVPDIMKMIHSKHTKNIQHQLNISADKINPDNIPEYQNMIHPANTKCVFAFFSRIPEGIPHLHNFLQHHTPIRIILKKLQGDNSTHHIYGMNFPHKKGLIRLHDQHVEKLCDRNKDWYGYFAGSNSDLLFKKVPCAAVQTKTGVIPPFALKILDGE